MADAVFSSNDRDYGWIFNHLIECLKTVFHLPTPTLKISLHEVWGSVIYKIYPLIVMLVMNHFVDQCNLFDDQNNLRVCIIIVSLSQS